MKSKCDVEDSLLQRDQEVKNLKDEMARMRAQLQVEKDGGNSAMQELKNLHAKQI